MLSIMLGPYLLGKMNLNLGFIYLNEAYSADVYGRDVTALEKSEQFFNDASTLPQLNRVAHRGLGFTLWPTGEKRKAVAAWKEAGLTADYLISLGDLAYGSGNQRETLGWYEAASMLDLAAGIGPFTEQLYKLRDYQVAIDLLQKALATYPNSPQRLLWWIDLLKNLNEDQQWDNAIEASSTALTEFPESAALLVSLSSTLINLETDHAQVSSLLQQAIALDADYAESYAIMGRLMADEDRYQQAYNYFGMAIERDPSVEWWHVAQANMANRLGNVDLSETLLRETIDLFPNYVPAFYELAGVLKLNGDHAGAQMAIEHALDLQVEPSLNHLVRAGEIYRWNKQFDLARSVYERASEISPNDRRVIEGLQAIKVQD
jgi:tetratricopeptide (TPR) repeat protein